MNKESKEKRPAPIGGEARHLSEGRPPVIVVLGHVDHGKTTLLDYIRKTNVAAREAGGITQSIGAYEITHAPHESRTDAETNAEDRGKGQRSSASSQRESAPAEGRRMTFIDTPGHEAFSKMRSRGAQVADLAILVVAVDDGVQPQTKEAIKIIQEAKIPYVVAINKVDKEGVDVSRAKNELTAAGVLLEGYGGNISYQPISGKTGKGVPELLDLLLLAADLEEMPFDPKNPAQGVILESKLESRRGIVATGIVKDGTLRVGDQIHAGSAFGKVKGLENFLGHRVKEIVPSSPAVILGFESLPEVGEKFSVGEKPLGDKAGNQKTRKPEIQIKEDELSANFILKADVSGTLEALKEVIKNMPKPDKIIMKIIDESVGDITDGDVKLAISSKASIIGFRVVPTRAAENLAQTHKIRIIISPIIYELLKAIDENFSRLDKTMVKGDLEILAIFGNKGSNQQVVGGKVIAGQILNNGNPEIERRGTVLGTGKILNLQKAKKDSPVLETGSEGGLLIDSGVAIKPGDHLIIR